MPVTRSIALLFVAEFLFYVSGYVVHLGAGRILGPEDYGRYGLVITATLLIANLIGNGVPIAMSKFLSELSLSETGKIRAVRRAGMALQALVMGTVTAAFFFVAEPLAVLLGDPTLAELFRLSALIIPCFSADAFYFYLYSGMQRFGIQSGLKIIRSVLRMTVILVLAALFSVKGIISGYIFVPLLVFLVALSIDVFTSVGTPRSEAPGRFPMARLFRLAIPVTAFLVLFEILMSFDLYFIKYFSGSDELSGQYNAALTIARIPTFLFYALTIILLPTISESFSKLDRRRAADILNNALRFMLILSVPFILCIAAYAQPVVELLFGEGFRPAAELLVLLSISSTLLAILYVVSFAYGGTGNTRVPVLAFSLALVANVVLDILLYPVAGIGGVPVAKLVVASVIFPVFLFSLSRTFDARFDPRHLGSVMLAAIPIALSAFFSGDSVSAFLGFAPLSLVAYGLLLYRFGVITSSDLAFLRRPAA